jgi:hypothetical protein
MGPFILPSMMLETIDNTRLVLSSISLIIDQDLLFDFIPLAYPFASSRGGTLHIQIKFKYYSHIVWLYVCFLDVACSIQETKMYPNVTTVSNECQSSKLLLSTHN